jgi:hypothetical protein
MRLATTSCMPIMQPSGPNKIGISLIVNLDFLDTIKSIIERKAFSCTLSGLHHKLTRVSIIRFLKATNDRYRADALTFIINGMDDQRVN